MPLQLIPYNHDHGIKLTDLANSIRGDRGGPLHVTVAYRWALYGVRIPDGTRLLLPTICLGRHRWLMRQWFDAWQAERGQLCVPRSPAPTPPEMKLKHRRNASGHERAVARLRKAGFKIGGAA